jgi:hypothetical protein
MRHIILVFSLLLFLGCSKVNKENYDSLRVGMSYDAVVAVLGKPNSCDSVGEASSCVWGNVSKNIKVRFVANRAVLINAQGIQ